MSSAVVAKLLLTPRDGFCKAGVGLFDFYAIDLCSSYERRG